MNDMRSFKPTEAYVRPVGRTYTDHEILWIPMSGSGGAFTFRGKKAQITLHAGTLPTDSNNLARIAIEVNGSRIIDDRLDQMEKTYTIIDSDIEQDVEVKVIKLSEPAMSTAGIREICTDGAAIQPAPALDRRIEFIGDSITAGYGVDDEVPEHSFSTATEDVTKTYAYKTSVALQAAFSIVAYSGYGIISGYTTDDQKLTTHLLPDYYDKVGQVDWDFSRFIPDLIVINLGTNDDSYTKDHQDRQQEYAEQYAAFLKQVRQHNPTSMILCTLGIMGDRLFPYLEQAVAAYKQHTGDTRVYMMKFDEQAIEDGFSADWHPTEATQTKAANKLIPSIKQLMNW